MTTTETTSYRIEDARSPLWFGRWPGGWGDVVHGVEPGAGCSRGRDDRRRRAWPGRSSSTRSKPCSAAATTASASRVPVPRVVANVRSDTRAVLGVVGEGYEPLQNRAAFAFCDAITDSGEAHWLGAAETRGGARVHALMQLDRDDPDRGRGGGGRAAAPLLPQRPRRRPRGDDQRRAVPARVPERDDAAARRTRERTWKARHTANLDARLADARRTLGIAWRYYDELEQVGGRLIRERMSAAEFERFLAQLVPLPEPRGRRDERRARRAQRRARARGNRDRLPGNARPREHHAARAGARCRP